MSGRIAPKIVTDGLILYLDAANSKSYPGSGTSWVDLINENDVTLTNGATFSSEDNGTMVFDGVDDYAVTANIFGPTEFTICAWCKVDYDGSDDYGRIVEKGFNSEWSLNVNKGVIPNDKFNFQYFDNANIVVSNKSIDPNKYQYVVCTIEDNGGGNKTGSIYIDGVFDNSGTRTETLASQNAPITIGGQMNELSIASLKGNIPVIQYYNRVLTPAEILQNYNALKGRIKVQSIQLTGFVSTWNTTFGDGNPTVALPLISTGTYSFTVDWGDGNTDTITSWNQAETTHTYATGGVKTISISGVIKGWSFRQGSEGQQIDKITSILQWGDLRLGNDSYYFGGCANLDLSAVSDVLDLTETTSLFGIFVNCTSITTINNIGSWNVSTITNMNSAFYTAGAFNGDISSWDVSSVTDMSYMFNGTQFNQPIGSWDVSNVTDMSGMFNSATSFNQPIGSWVVSNVTNMSYMFYNATAFNQDISTWNVSSVTNMSGMFLNSQFDQDIGSWTVSNVTDMSGMFSGSPFNQDVSSWNVSNVTNMSSMFASSPFNQDISSWNVSNVTNMNGMFSDASAFNQPLNSWNVSSVTDISNMFNSTPFNQDISSWNVSNVLYMYGLFYQSSFNQDIGSWTVSSVVDMNYMFASSPFNQNIGTWSVGSVSDMSYMFNNTPFDQPIGNWNVSSVNNMSSMFGNSPFNQDIGSWSVANVSDMSYMFYNSTSFNQDIGSWSVVNVTNMSSMFQGATTFNGDISSWNVSNVSDFSNFMTGKSTGDFSYYDNLLNSWSLLTLQNGVTLDMGSIEYTSAGSASRASIISNYTWTINDGGLATIPLDTAVYYTSYFTSSLSPSPINIGDSITNYYKYNDATATASATGVTNFFGGYTQGYATFSQFNGSNISYISGTYTVGGDIGLVSYEDPTSDISFIHGSGSSYSIYFVGRPEVFLDATNFQRSTIFNTEDWNNNSGQKWEKLYVSSPGASQGNTFSVVFESQQNTGFLQNVINRIEFEVGLTAAAFDSQPLRIFSVLGQNVGNTISTAVWAYVDDILVATQSHTNAPDSNDPSGGQLELFAESQGFDKGSFYKGYFGELLIYNYKHDSTTHTSVINQLKSRWNI